MRNRTKTFSVRLSVNEYEILNRAIEKCNMTKSAFIRMVANMYLPKERPPDGYDEIISELTEIGNKLYHISNTKTFDADSVKEQADRLDKAILKINEGLELGGVRRPLAALIPEDMKIVEEAAKMIRDAKEKYL